MARRKVNLDSIDQAALEISRRQGFSTLGLADVARSLGIKPPSLFNHVKNLDEIKDRVRAFAVADLARALEKSLESKSGDEALLALARAWRAWAKRNDGLYPAAVQPAENFSDLVKTVGRVFDGAGMNEDERGHRARALAAMLHGWTDLERPGLFGTGQDMDWSFSMMVSRFSRSNFENA